MSQEYDGPVNWREEAKSLEQQFMVLKDQYAEIARALGFEGDAWFGDPLPKHAEIVARAIAVTAGDRYG